MRYDQEGVHGLKNKPRSGRPSKLSKDCFRNKKRTF
jgi:transposase